MAGTENAVISDLGLIVSVGAQRLQGREWEQADGWSTKSIFRHKKKKLEKQTRVLTDDLTADIKEFLKILFHNSLY